MRVLLVNQPWPVFGGSETYLLTIGPELEKLGHEVWIHAPAQGEAARLAKERGLRVLRTAAELPADPQVVLTQDGESCAEMARRYPDAIRPYVVHAGPFLPQLPPQVPGAQHAIVTMNDGTERLSRALAHRPEVVRLRQPVDLERFRNRGEPPRELRRVLLLGSHWALGPRNQRVVAAACARLGLELGHVGVNGHLSLAPEIEIADADAVLGVGRCIVEAMASQRAAYVFGETGVDGWVDPGNYLELEARGFTGGATATAIDTERLCEDLRAYDPEMGHRNRNLALAHHSARRHTAELVGLVERLEPVPVADPSALETVARLVRVQWQLSSRLGLAEGDSAWLRTENRRLVDENRWLADENAKRRRHLDAVLNGRRYRLAQRVGRPIDAVRSLRKRANRGAQDG